MNTQIIIETLHFARVNNINQDTNIEQTMIDLYHDYIVYIHVYQTATNFYAKLKISRLWISLWYLIQELAGGSEEAPVSPDEQSTPEQCISKLTALIRCVLQKIPPSLPQIVSSNIFCSFLSPLLQLASPHFFLLNIFISDSFL